MRFHVGKIRGLAGILLIAFMLSALMSFASPPQGAVPGNEEQDPYTMFLKGTWGAAQHWKGATSHQAQKFCLSTWEGTSGDFDKASLYVFISIQEEGLKHFENEAYYGWTGGRWGTIVSLLKKDGMKKEPPEGWREYIRAHQWTVNRLLAKLFSGLVDKYGTETALRVWKKGWEWQKDVKVKEDTDLYLFQLYTLGEQCKRYGISSRLTPGLKKFKLEVVR